MTKDVLIQYADLQEEIKDIRRRMEKTESRLTRIRQEGTVIDSVTGTRADGTIGHIRIEGFPYAAHDKQSTHLRLYAAQLAEREERLLEQTNAVGCGGLSNTEYWIVCHGMRWQIKSVEKLPVTAVGCILKDF